MSDASQNQDGERNCKKMSCNIICWLDKLLHVNRCGGFEVNSDGGQIAFLREGVKGKAIREDIISERP